jgi:hypothetical protein
MKADGRDAPMEKKKIAMNEAEWRLALHALNELRNNLIAEGRFTDTVDDAMAKIIKAPIRKVRATRQNT